MKNHSLSVYFIILVALCGVVVGGARALGQQGAYLAQAYMLTPAIAALITRLFFYKPHFKDANLRFGRACHIASCYFLVSRKNNIQERYHYCVKRYDLS